MVHNFLKCFTIFLLSGLTISEISAANIKTRMKKREKDICQLKKDGKIGENNKGYLTELSNIKNVKAEELTDDEREIVNAENKDRKVIYKKFASRMKTSTEDVGKTRAVQFSNHACKGEWIQKKDGKWSKKK